MRWLRTSIAVMWAAVFFLSFETAAQTPPPPFTSTTDPSLLRTDAGSSTEVAPSSTEAFAQGSIGFLGCSFSNNAVIGYRQLGGRRFWDPVRSYNGGSVSIWASGVGNRNRYWLAFESALKSHPRTQIFWWQLCNSPQADEATLFRDARLVLEEIRRRVPGATVYVSAQHSYTQGHACRGQADGPARMQRLADRLVAEGSVQAGPTLGPLSPSQTLDGCHANRIGMETLGQQLLNFFDKQPAKAVPAPKNRQPGLLRYEIDQTKHPRAVCNDGSTPVFYYQRGWGSGANRWVLWFKGGGACYDRSSCEGRDRDLISAIPWKRPSIAGQGILSSQPTQNPDFYNWNRVILVYCTSDQWTGAREDRDNELQWYFRGHFVTHAMVDGLMDRNLIGSPTLREATHVLLTGSSAGAHGLRQNADWLAAMLSWADVRLASDAGLGFAMTPALQAVGKQMHERQWNTWKPILDESCMAAHSATPARCLDQHLLIKGKYIATEMFLRVDLIDPLPLRTNGLSLRNPKHRPQIREFVNEIANLLRSQKGAFGTRKGQHVMIESKEFHSYRVDGLTFADVLGNWYFNRNGPKVIIELPPG